MSKVQPRVKKLYYSIGEVSELTGLKAYVLRYWQTEFSQLNPPKNRAGNRTYRQKDIDVILNIKDLLYKKKYTIEGARSFISGHKRTPVVKKQMTKQISIDEKQQVILNKIQKELNSIIHIIKE